MNASDGENFLARLNNLALVRFLLLSACGWTIVQLIAYFQAVIVIFSFAAILAFLLSYPVEWLKHFLPRTVAVVLIFLVSIVAFGSLAITAGLGLLSQGQQFIDSVASFFNSLIPLVEQLEEILSKRNLQIDLSALEQVLREQAISRLINILDMFQSLITNFATFILIA
ncbi:MAG: AI-2E family transporter, partial [Cyanobacteria bacterium J06635_10]